MSELNFKKNKPNKKSVNNKAFYLSLSVCLIAIGVASFVALQSSIGIVNSDNASSIASVSSRNSSKLTVATASSQEEVSPSVSSNKPSVSSNEQAVTPPVVSSQAPLVSSSEPAKVSQTVASNEKYIPPVTGKVLKGYSQEQPQYSYTFKDWRIHLGVDLASTKNATVVSVGNGKVLQVYKDDLLGNVVEIEYSNDIVVKYCGLSNSTVAKKGNMIKIGETIGSIGDTPFESVEESHLHLEVLKNGENVDPIKTLGLNIK